MNHRQSVDHLGNPIKPIKQSDTWLNASLLVMFVIAVAIIYYAPAP